MVAEVACVLRSGGQYRPEHVHVLVAGLEEHLPGCRAVVLTDLPVADVAGPGLRVVPLEYDWPRWWAKLELFRPGVFDGPVLYVDLDTLPVGPLAELAAHDCDLAMLRDFYNPDLLTQSGVLLFTPGPATEAVWEAWTADPGGHMKRCRGDGEWMHGQRAATDLIQDRYPGQVVSLKRHARDGCPDGARLVCAHGVPKFWDPDARWAHEVWTGRRRRLEVAA